MSKEKPVIGTEGIYDARTLGAPRMLVLGIQHMFAMFGATVLVPVLTGLSVTTTLLFAGLGTLLFHLLAKGKVPAFLGSSFAFLAGYQAIAPNKEPELLPYACAGVAVAGLLYVILAALFRAFGAQKVMRFFPPIVTGPVIICIGLTLSSSALNNCAKNWPIALVAIVVVIVCNIWGKGSRSSPSCWALSPPMWWPLLPATWTSPWWKRLLGSALPLKWNAPCSPCSVTATPACWSAP